MCSVNAVGIVIRACDLEFQITRYESYFPSDPRDKREANKEFKNDIKPTKLKETMIVFTTPSKASSKPKAKDWRKIPKNQTQEIKKSTLK